MAMACLVAVVIAGVVKLTQIDRDGNAVKVLPIGERAMVGEMEVAVLSISTSGEQTVVKVEIGGVEDEDGSATWRLLSGGKIYEPVTGMEPDQCGATSIAVDTCTLVFDAAGPGRSVAYSRAGEQRNWSEP